MLTAAGYAADLVAAVRDDPAGRVAVMSFPLRGHQGRPRCACQYRRAALGFMRWQLHRGLPRPGGRARAGQSLVAGRQRARLLRDTAEARGHVLGLGGPLSSWSATCCAEFALQPSARTWYRAHNASIVAAYLEHRELAGSETYAERFFLNLILVLVRVLFAHALVAAPRLAPGCRPSAPCWVTRGSRSPASSSRCRGSCPTPTR